MGIVNIMDYEDKIKYIADTYGRYNQQIKAIEECLELATALIKSNSTRHDVITEMADVRVMLDQLTYLLDCKDAVDKERVYKVNRQMERIGTDCSWGEPEDE